MRGKVAIVSGSARGLGRAAAEALAQEGASVVITDVLDDEGAAVAARLREAGLSADYQHLDVCEPKEWQSVIETTMTQHGRVDCLVNNAGISISVTIEEATLEQFRSVFDVNVLSVFLGTKAVLPAMRASGGGSIVNVSSNSTAMSLPTTSLYGASKAAVANLSKTTAVHCGVQGYGIRVNSIHPGPHETNMLTSPEVRDLPHIKAMVDAIPLGRMGQPHEFGRLVVFLACDDSSYITAAEFFTDGGLTAVSFASDRPAVQPTPGPVEGAERA